MRVFPKLQLLFGAPDLQRSVSIKKTGVMGSHKSH